MMAKPSIVILITMQSYLRNWIQAGAFDELMKRYDVHFVVVKYNWDPREIERYGIENYRVISQANYRMFLLRRLLTVTMYKHAQVSRAFRIKLSLVRPRIRFLYRMLSLPLIYDLLLGLYKIVLPSWTEFAGVVKTISPSLVIAPSLAADSFTIDMTYTARKLGVKSMLLINSWDNLISKGVLPIPPDCLVVWGPQGVSQATKVQQMPPGSVVALGVPRFEVYYSENKRDFSIHAFNKIPSEKKILLYAATAMPFDDVQALQILDRAISETYSNYVILFRPHPEMHKRIGEANIAECGFRNVYIDQQVAAYYASRFQPGNDDPPSYVNNAELDYYPVLMKSIVGTICPPTTLSLEGAINGIPCLMICYGDGKNFWLTPDLMSQYENVEEVLSFPGIIPCRSEAELESCFRKLLAYSQDENIKKELVRATEYVVSRSGETYKSSLCALTDRLLQSGKCGSDSLV